MQPGDSCTYKTKAVCGSPSFQVDPSSTITPNKVNITFVEYTPSNKATKIANKSNQTSSISDRKSLAPKDDMPARNQKFSDTGNQTQYKGQQKPAYVNKDGKKVTDSVALQGDKKPQPLKKDGTLDLAKIF